MELSVLARDGTAYKLRFYVPTTVRAAPTSHPTATSCSCAGPQVATTTCSAGHDVNHPSGTEASQHCPPLCRCTMIRYRGPPTREVNEATAAAAAASVAVGRRVHHDWGLVLVCRKHCSQGARAMAVLRFWKV